MFEYTERALTPSFVGDAIAPAANNRYSVPYESSYPSQGYHILYCEYLWIQYMVF